MNSDQEKIIKEMGLGPIWKLRQDLYAPVVPEHDTVSLAQTHQDGNHSIELAGQVSESNTAGRACCAVCGMTDASSKVLSNSENSRPHYLIVAGVSGHAGNDHESSLAGVAGTLLNNMLLALGMQKNRKIVLAHIVRKQQVEILPIVNAAYAQEFSACFSCLKKQIELIEPLMIIVLGDASARSLLDLDNSTSSGNLRGQVHQLQGSPLVVTTHPVDLVRKLKEKANVWSDLCLAMANLTAT